MIDRFGVTPFRLLALASIGVFVVCSLLLNASTVPTRDEGWDADPGYQLYSTGHLRSLVLDPSSPAKDACEGAGCLFHSDKPTQMRTWSAGTDKHVYWHMPLHLALQAGWYRIAGFGLMQLRLISTFFAAVLLLAWYVVVRRLSSDPLLPLLAITLLACDFVFIGISSFGRMDMMCLALSVSGWALYLTFREEHFSKAVLSAASLIGLACLTHPNALLGGAGLLVIAIYLDRWRLSWKIAVLAALPLAICGLAWGLYILQDPNLFVLQFFGNAAGRGAGLLKPWLSLSNEALRHLSVYGLSDGAAALGRLKVIVLAAYLFSAIAVWRIPVIRQDRRLCVLLLLNLLGFAYSTFWDRYKLEFYFVNSIPFYTVSVAMLAAWAWRKQPQLRPVVTGVLAVILAVDVATVLNRVRRDQYHTRYLPVVNLLKQRVRAGDVVMSTADLGFGLGFNNHLVDDQRLGYYSGRTFDFLVRSNHFDTEILPDVRQFEPEVWKHVEKVLASGYVPIFQNDSYTVLQNRRPSDTAAGKMNLPDHSYR